MFPAFHTKTGHSAQLPAGILLDEVLSKLSKMHPQTTKHIPKRQTDTTFGKFAAFCSRKTGRPAAFGLAAGIVLVWMLTGPVFKFSDTWQLVINTGTTIVTFLMVFLIQNGQNRDTEALHLKLDELIRATKGAHNALLDVEKLSENNLEQIQADYERLAKNARGKLRPKKKLSHGNGKRAA